MKRRYCTPLSCAGRSCPARTAGQTSTGAFRYVSVSYDSCSPNNSGGKVRIELYIDDDEDGVYELYDPNGGYTYQLVVGELIKIELPLGNTVAKYRLRFVNLTSSVTSGNFTVTTSRN